MSTASSDQPRPPRRKRVLIIEDDRRIASAIRSILTRRGYDVSATTTLAQGLAMLADEQPDYIVLDLVLPDGSGVEILRRVRQSNDRATRVVVTTAVSDPGKLRDVLALQPHRLLHKPIDLVDLLDAIEMM